MRATTLLVLPVLAPAVLSFPQARSRDVVGNGADEVPRSIDSLADVAWDIIIVGAGPAGIVMADRMSEVGKKTLLLEQGGPSYYITGGRERPSWLAGTELSRVDVPGLYKSIYTNPSSSLLCSSSQLNSYSACTIGGCTAINAGLFFQPPASDFDRYFPTQWKSTDMQSAISKLRAKQPFTLNPSKNGQFYVQSGYDAAKKWLVGGAGFSNIGINKQANNKKKVFGRPEFSYVDGQRSGAVKTYLQSALTRSNFLLQSSTKVNRVLRNGSTATGVVAVVNGQTTTINVAPTGRVILSGGALFSPQLLMLSGIGDPSQLSNLARNGHLSTPSSQWINNTAVGVGLFDNPNTFIELSGPSIQSYVYSYNTPIPSSKSLYLNERSGPYAFASETSVFWDTIAHSDGSVTGLQGTIDSSGYSDYTSKQTITLNVYGTSGLLSTGKVTLDQNGIATPSTFFYSDPGNRDSLDIATFIHNIFQSLPGSGLTPLNIAQNSSISDIQKYITTPSAYAKGNVNHWSSSCRLGQCVDLNTVVKGTSNLHVVDGSIVAPLTVNPSMGIMIAAERAAELILKL